VTKLIEAGRIGLLEKNAETLRHRSLPERSLIRAVMPAVKAVKQSP